MRVRGGLLGLALLVPGLVGCSSSRPSPAVGGAWTAVAAAPISVLEVGAAARDGRIWVAGGLRADGTASDDVVVFDPETGTWASGPKLPEPVHHASLVSDADGLLLVGGYTPTGPTAATRRLAEGATAWTDGPPLPDARAAGAAAFDGSRVVFAGGVGPDGVKSEVFALAEGTWRRIARLPRAREHLGAAGDGAGRTFILGGRVGGLDNNLAVVDIVEGSRARTIGQLPTPRGGVAGFWWPTVGACLAGGESPGGANPQVECIDADGTVRVLPDLGVARHGVGAAVIDGAVYVVLGGRQPGLFVSDVSERLVLP
jgi:non-specific serine/threonine protein kinase